jgi:hypothetical protein
LSLWQPFYECSNHAGQHCAELECTRNTETYRLLPLLAQRKVRADWIFEGILCHATLYDADVVESLPELAIEIAREGREGTRVGQVFTLGDEDSVLARSKPLILDPLLGHPESARQRNMSAVTKATALWFQRSRWYESSVTVNWSVKSFPGCGSWNMLPTFAVL